MTVVADFTQLTALAAQLAAAPVRAQAQGASLVREGVREGAEAAQDLIRSQVRGVYLPHYPDAITAEMTSPLSGQFGPDESMPQGGMGPGVEFGSANAPPLAHMGPAADQIEQTLADEALDVAVDSLW